MRLPVLLTLCVGVALCANETNPFLADADREVAIHELTTAYFNAYVKVKKKGYHVVVLENLPKERHELECPAHCTWMDKQFSGMAEAYLTQRNGKLVYEYDGRQLYFARVSSESRRPTLMLFKSNDARGTKYGHANLLEPAKKEPAHEKLVKENREKLGKTLKSVRRADARSERRRRQFTTQEVREEGMYGVRDYQMPWMNNLCKWIKLETKHLLHECPQDVDRNIAATEKKSETGKQILVAIIGVSSLLYIARAFGILLKPIDSSAEDKKRLLHKAKYIAELQDEHVMHSIVDGWWQVWTTLAFLACLVLVSCCASGMYWNFLNKQPLLGGDFGAPYPRFTGWTKSLPMQSVAIALAVSTASLSLLALGRVATINYVYLKFPLFFVCTCLWVASGSFLLYLFVERNQYYLQNTFMHDKLHIYLGK